MRDSERRILIEMARKDRMNINTVLSELVKNCKHKISKRGEGNSAVAICKICSQTLAGIVLNPLKNIVYISRITLLTQILTNAVNIVIYQMRENSYTSSWRK
jgi:hypothetical protein